MTSNDNDQYQTEEVLFMRSSKLSEVSTEVALLSRKNHSALLRKMNEVGQVHVAHNFVVHEASISRMKSEGELERIAVFLAACGIELESADTKLYPIKVVEALRTLSQANLSSLVSH